MDFELRDRAIDEAVKAQAPASSGAVVTFEGLVRDHNEGRRVVALEYSAYPELALREGNRILAEAAVRFPIERARAIHRTGLLKIGESAVWIEVAAAHRGAAFEACRWIIDEIKDRVPLWKKEHYAEGASEWLLANPPAEGGLSSTPADSGGGA